MAATGHRPRAYLVDASIYVFRAWFTYPDDLADRDGWAANAVHGFTDFLDRLLTRVQPEYIACAFDESLSTSFRNAIYPAYKANREPAPEALKRQFDWCRQAAVSLGIPVYSSPHYEADDIIATLATGLYRADIPVTVVSSDKDLTQLLAHEDDEWWDFARNLRLDAKRVEARFGVPPDRIADLLALAGDSVDNIPGVPGIGPKTAAQLIGLYGGLDDIYAALDMIPESGLRGAERVRRLLREHEAGARLAHRLTRVYDRVPLAAAVDDLAWRGAQSDLVCVLAEQFAWSPFRQRRWLSLVP